MNLFAHLRSSQLQVGRHLSLPVVDCTTAWVVVAVVRNTRTDSMTAWNTVQSHDYSAQSLLTRAVATASAIIPEALYVLDGEY